MTSNCTRELLSEGRPAILVRLVEEERNVRLADLKGRSVAVWGTGREGRAAVTAIVPHAPSRLLAVDDSANFLSIKWEGPLAEAAPLAGGDHAFPALVTADVVVRSPGVPQTHPWM